MSKKSKVFIPPCKVCGSEKIQLSGTIYLDQPDVDFTISTDSTIKEIQDIIIRNAMRDWYIDDVVCVCANKKCGLDFYVDEQSIEEGRLVLLAPEEDDIQNNIKFTEAHVKELEKELNKLRKILKEKSKIKTASSSDGGAFL